MLGLSFKAGTDDVRDSQVVPLIETLVGRGFNVSVYDDEVRIGALVGTNRAFLEEKLPHITSLMRPDLDALIAESEVVVIASSHPKFVEVMPSIRRDQVVVDLVGITSAEELDGEYEGICW